MKRFVGFVGILRGLVLKSNLIKGGIFTMRKKESLLLTLAVVWLLSGVSLSYAVPGLINYQGRLADSTTGEAVTGSRNITFTIYDAETSGNTIWQETQSVEIAKGLFNVLLGSVNLIGVDVFKGDSRFLGIKIGDGAEGSPRQRLVSVGYAMTAGTATYAGQAGLAGTATYALTANRHYIGESYGGGKVFWVDSSGQHGLVAATFDQSTGIRWHNGAYTVTNAVRDGVYAGQYNTERIIANQDVGNYAAQICANYQGGGYGDWYLPSKYELNLLYLQRTVVGGFAGLDYWSSTEFDSNGAWFQFFGNGNQNSNYKYYPGCVRAVRAF